MDIVVDGIVYKQQPFGGISRIFNEILPRICDLDEAVRITLFTEGRTLQQPPRHRGIHHKSLPDLTDLLRPRRVFAFLSARLQSKMRAAILGNGENRIWHSTYYSLPGAWKGKTVVTVADMIFERFPEFFSGSATDDFKALKLNCIRAADAVSCISETTRKDVVAYSGVDPAKCHVIPLAHGSEFKKIETPAAVGRIGAVGKFLFYIGARVPYKNYDLLIEAYSNWKDSDKVALVLVGAPLGPDEKKRLEELHILDRVHCFSGVNDSELNLLYNLAEAFVYPSLYEGFGIPLLEAMTCGCPLIASDIPSTAEIAGDCPIYFQPQDMEGLISAFERATEDGRDSERVRNGFRRAGLYSWDKTAEETLKLYANLI